MQGKGVATKLALLPAGSVSLERVDATPCAGTVVRPPLARSSTRDPRPIAGALEVAGPDG